MLDRVVAALLAMTAKSDDDRLKARTNAIPLAVH